MIRGRCGSIRACVLLSSLAAFAGGCAGARAPGAGPAPLPAGNAVIPAPASMRLTGAPPFQLTADTRVVVPAGGGEAARVGDYLAGLLRPATGFPLQVESAGGGGTSAITLRLATNDSRLGDEGYALSVTADSVVLTANRPAGLFYGVQTLRQLLPPSIEADRPRQGPWSIPAGRIVDSPRYQWRGAMLDVARHFFTVDEVKQYIDLLALYKINHLHLHLSDDQGWRIQIRSWPRLTEYGGSLEVGGTPGGYYTQAEYEELVRYAADRFITVVPEIDMPSHINAALASYPELNCDGVAPPLYGGTNVGFSAFCTGKDITYRFIDDVMGELADLTPGPFLHVGGDEVKTLDQATYNRFIERVQQIVNAHGKRMIGWDEVENARLSPGSVVQVWRSDTVRAAPANGSQLIMSPAPRAYFDMKYDSLTPLGLDWAGHVSVRKAYDWNPSALVPSAADSVILGVEAPIWSETLTDIHDVEYMALPRIPALAEVGWSPQSARDWENFRRRLAAQAPRWVQLRLLYFRSPEVPWKP
ncbi:MAG TPA: beta-N-acetylhexosaminidase [Longimicrobiaceae bacterium]|nr:beta-N-acetylhexosaminidase [Longimicrobiaceae bacterium]